MAPGREALIPSPYWVSYPELVRMSGGVPKIIPTQFKQGWKVTRESLLKQTSSLSQVLIINNACNPTGVLYSREELRELLQTAKECNLMVISDEVYSGLVYNNERFVSCGSFPEYEDIVTIVQSCSKNFGMTGWRVGFALAPEHIIQELCLFSGQTTNGTPLPSQWAAIGALEKKEETGAYIQEAMQLRRDRCIQTFDSLFPGAVQAPPSSVYIFASLSAFGLPEKTNSALFCEDLMNFYNVAVVPGEAFGQPGWIRFAFTEPEELLEEGLRQFHRGVTENFEKIL
jgi:aspartate/methionine/tyrosine aminotransferase